MLSRHRRKVTCRPLSTACRSIKALWTDHQPWENGGPCKSSLNTIHPQPNITKEGVQLKCVESFKYLGSLWIAEQRNFIKNPQGQPSSRKTESESHPTEKHQTIDKAQGLHDCSCLHTILHGYETWTTYRRHIEHLEQFHTRTLHMIMGIHWQGRVTNQEVLDRAGSTSIESMLLKARLRWTGHAIRMSDSRIPRQLMYDELMQSSRKQGRPKLRYKVTMKSNLKWSGIVIIIIIIIIIIITAFKGAIRAFLQSPHSAANCLQHVRSSGPGTCNTSSAYHVQVSCYVPLGTKGQFSY